MNQPPKWHRWLPHLSGRVILAVALATLAAGAVLVVWQPWTAPAAACSDGVDNERDGKMDFPQDSGCSSRTDSSEDTVACSDGRDNDGDGKTDFPRDSNCSSRTDPSEKDPACSDGRDNDSDDKTDFPQDPDCSSLTDPSEMPTSGRPLVRL